MTVAWERIENTYFQKVAYDRRKLKINVIHTEKEQFTLDSEITLSL